MGKLTGKTAAITGGASGIGHAVADLFAKEGARVAIIDKNGEAAKKAAAHIARKRNAKVIAAAADVGDEKQVKRAFAAIVKALGDVDILFNNAGFDTTSPVAQMSAQMWDDMIRVHMRGVFLCAREVIPGMQRKRWGRIINTSSQLAHKGGATMAHYCAAKAGIMGFTRSLAYEVIKDGITVNCLNPGPIDTPLLRSIPKAWMKDKLKELPIGRAGHVDEVAPAVLLLASDEGAYFVGASMNMNGGDYMV